MLPTTHFPCHVIILLFLGNQFVNNLCVFLGRGGGVANVAVAKLPRVISTKLYTLTIYNAHTHNGRYFTYTEPNTIHSITKTLGKSQ